MECTSNRQGGRVLRKREVFNRTGLSQSTVYRMEKAGKFPKRVQLSVLCVGWIEAEVEDWIRQRADNRAAGCNEYQR
jgi:prophage regulatory protein